MRLRLIALFLMLSALPVSAQTQSAMNEEACNAYRKADATLNSVYKQILKTYARQPRFLARLKTAQLRWIQLRDADLRALYPEDPGDYGSVQPMCECTALAELTEARTKYLRRWLAPFQEGDVCAGSTAH
jgi:uncharacterized protein YecT (DUF1311 family)